MRIQQLECDREKGRIIRGCLAFKRSCKNKTVGQLVLNIGISFFYNDKNLKYIKYAMRNINMEEVGEECREAVKAINNAVEDYEDIRK
jgi:hypothetical protein